MEQQPNQKGKPRIDLETLQRDHALDLLAAARADLIAEARVVADLIHREHGRVTAVEVLRFMGQLDETGLRTRLIDRRFVGVVFRKGWKRIGYEPTGSHKRPVSIWTKEE